MFFVDYPNSSCTLLIFFGVGILFEYAFMLNISFAWFWRCWNCGQTLLFNWTQRLKRKLRLFSISFSKSLIFSSGNNKERKWIGETEEATSRLIEIRAQERSSRVEYVLIFTENVDFGFIENTPLRVTINHFLLLFQHIASSEKKVLIMGKQWKYQH